MTRRIAIVMAAGALSAAFGCSGSTPPPAKKDPPAEKPAPPPAPGAKKGVTFS